MKKIIVDKSEGIAEVIEKILGEDDAEITLVIPRDSALGQSVSNFHLLKREADSADKTINVESVDDAILAFAKESNISADHPLWRSGKASVSDIVPRHAHTSAAKAEADEEEPPAKPKRGRKKAERVRPEPAPVIAHEHEPEEEEEIEEEREEEIREERVNAAEMRAERRASKRFLVAAGIVLGVVIVGVYLTTVFFNRADVTINFQKTPWAYQSNFIADKNATQTAPGSGTTVIPAQVFNSNKNVTGTFAASGRGNVSQKAQGTITIYNNYGADPQELVATTRFLTPDGKLFRLVNDVVVPGAQVVNGTITPSSIIAPIIADQPGPAYNIGPVSHLSIPGFQGTAKFNGFYGAITGTTTGGYVGTRATPTAADVSAAKASTTAMLQAALQGGFSGNYPDNFKILDGATSIQIGKLIVNTSTDDNGNFTVFGQAMLQAIGFDESAFKTYLLSLANVQNPNSIFTSLTLNYASVKADFSKGQVSFALSAQGALEPSFSADDFKSSISGKSINDARSTIQALPELSDGRISVWPFWLWSIPTDPKKVHITVN